MELRKKIKTILNNSTVNTNRVESIEDLIKERSKYCFYNGLLVGLSIAVLIAIILCLTK